MKRRMSLRSLGVMFIRRYAISFRSVVAFSIRYVWSSLPSFGITFVITVVCLYVRSSLRSLLRWFVVTFVRHYVRSSSRLFHRNVRSSLRSSFRSFVITFVHHYIRSFFMVVCHYVRSSLHLFVFTCVRRNVPAFVTFVRQNVRSLNKKVKASQSMSGFFQIYCSRPYVHLYGCLFNKYTGQSFGQ